MRIAALLVGGRFGRAVLAGDAEPEPGPESPDWELFERHSAGQITRLCRLAAVLLVSFMLVVWALETLVMTRAPAEQAVFTTWRLLVIGTFGALYLLLGVWPIAARHPVLTSAPFCAGACAVVSHFVAGLGGLETPFFYMLCAVLFVPVPAPAHMVARGLFLLGLALALVFGFFGGHPAHARSPLVAEAFLFMGSVLVASAMIGHVAYVGTCRRFFQGLALQRSAAALEELNHTLDGRVRRKTADLAQLADHLQVVQDEERGRISRELHDELGQRLSAMRYVLAHLRRRFEHAPTTIGPNLDEVDKMLDDTLGCMRAVVSGLRPPLLDQLGLIPAVEWLVQRTGERTGLVCTVTVSGEETREPATSVAAYRVLQESLTNVTRHAEARRVDIHLRLDAEGVSLEIVDDGRGFPPGGPERAHDQNGILGMRERARALGGELHTDNAPAGGARVRLTLPAASAHATAALT